MLIRNPNELLLMVKTVLNDLVITSKIFKDELTITVPSEEIYRVLETLKNNEHFKFSQLTDITAVDYAAYGLAEWDVEATNYGFSRAVCEETVGRAQDKLQETMKKSSMENRFAVVYHLLSMEFNARIRVKCFIDGDEQGTMPMVDSVSSLWPSANWDEREVFDMFGIGFMNHPDLRRILTDYGFIGYPLRKDFPLTGHVEIIYDSEKRRVIYQPVSIESRVNVPRVIRQQEGKN